MGELIKLQSFHDSRGSLTVLEKVLNFDIKRVYYIYNTTNLRRGNHKHLKTIQAAICLSGKCTINIENGNENKSYLLDSPEKCLKINPEDWHYMDDFSSDCILLVLASEYYDESDYIYQK
jgi:dTDP-4-dehydrorhamnose 3,5-epimerase-like enzyme